MQFGGVIDLLTWIQRKNKKREEFCLKALIWRGLALVTSPKFADGFEVPSEMVPQRFILLNKI